MENAHPYVTQEFGDAYALPDAWEMPDGFEVSTYRNDACPSIRSRLFEGYQLQIWLDAANSAHRDCDMGGRFAVSFLDADLNACAYDSPVISDNWADIEAFVNAWFDSPTFDRFDICEAYAVLEWDHNVGGWLRERPSNQRRMEACSVQLARVKFKPAPSLCYDSLSENGKAIYWQAARRLHLI